ncbi:hypothetical protein SKAU_G00045810 [Synaphobranchus kaupii]|uniref:Uncharacterized protein n=1 Tax=Synaphobranchus kaupii TaxID=118154 RepID=A0A9Q1G2U6_SYNKA|nr:hypothetical protein SKAU_G00045810 [Synaphobranchus kaupii]
MQPARPTRPGPRSAASIRDHGEQPPKAPLGGPGLNPLSRHSLSVTQDHTAHPSPEQEIDAQQPGQRHTKEILAQISSKKDFMALSAITLVSVVHLSIHPHMDHKLGNCERQCGESFHLPTAKGTAAPHTIDL